jgi:hypothetical protein
MKGTAFWVALTVVLAVADGLLWRFRGRLVGHGIFVSRGVVPYAFALILITAGLAFADVLIRIA